MIAEILNYHNQHHVAKKAQGVDAAKHSLQKHLDGFLREHQKQAYAIALMSVKQESDAMDVIQETMMAFVQYYQKKPADNWRPLFYRVLQNKINDHHRKQQGWRKYFFSNNQTGETAEPATSPDPTPQRLMETMNAGQAMIGYLQQLPAQQKQVMIYRHWQQLSVAETADVMQISTGSVKTHLHRATQKLQQLAGQDHE